MFPAEMLKRLLQHNRQWSEQNRSRYPIGGHFGPVTDIADQRSTSLVSSPVSSLCRDTPIVEKARSSVVRAGFLGNAEPFGSFARRETW